MAIYRTGSEDQVFGADYDADRDRGDESEGPYCDYGESKDCSQFATVTRVDGTKLCAACDEWDRLMDAAPDLLAALKNYQNYDLTLEARQNAAIAAIAKATGR